MNRLLKFRSWSGLKMNYEFIVARPQFANCLSIMSNEDFAVKTYNSINEWKVMQFTGLYDKNEMEIWEGDIIRVDGYNRVFTMEFYPKIGIYGLFDGKDDKPLGREGSSTKYEPYLLGIDYWKKKMQIIGNKYENPELLNK